MAPHRHTPAGGSRPGAGEAAGEAGTPLPCGLRLGPQKQQPLRPLCPLCLLRLPYPLHLLRLPLHQQGPRFPLQLPQMRVLRVQLARQFQCHPGRPLPPRLLPAGRRRALHALCPHSPELGKRGQYCLREKRPCPHSPRMGKGDAMDAVPEFLMAAMQRQHSLSRWCTLTHLSGRSNDWPCIPRLSASARGAPHSTPDAAGGRSGAQWR